MRWLKILVTRSRIRITQLVSFSWSEYLFYRNIERSVLVRSVIRNAFSLIFQFFHDTVSIFYFLLLWFQVLHSSKSYPVGSAPSCWPRISDSNIIFYVFILQCSDSGPFALPIYKIICILHLSYIKRSMVTINFWVFLKKFSKTQY